MTDETLRLRREDFNRRVGQAILNVYRLAASGGGGTDEAVATPYRELVDAADRRFRAAAEGGDLQGMADGWNELVDIGGHMAHANARVGAALLATIMNTSGLSADEVMDQTIKLVESS
jgi:hypothetical protein